MITPEVAHQHMTHLLGHYGSVALFAFLALGIVGLPVPDETLLVVAGFLMAKGKISLIATPIAAFLGSAVGITISYLLGFYIGKAIFKKYGKWLGVTEARLNKAHDWFQRVGKWILLIGYFIPGARHIIGILAGTAYLRYWQFALFAYTGALIWSSLFIAIGFYFYNAWHTISKFIV